MNQTDYDAIARIMWESDDLPMDLATYFTQEAEMHISTYGCDWCQFPQTFKGLCPQCGSGTPITIAPFDREAFIAQCYGRKV